MASRHRWGSHFSLRATCSEKRSESGGYVANNADLWLKQAREVLREYEQHQSARLVPFTSSLLDQICSAGIPPLLIFF